MDVQADEEISEHDRGGPAGQRALDGLVGRDVGGNPRAAELGAEEVADDVVGDGADGGTDDEAGTRVGLQHQPREAAEHTDITERDQRAPARQPDDRTGRVRRRLGPARRGLPRQLRHRPLLQRK